MIVSKFGGTSVADRDAQRRLARIVASRLDAGPLVVVSALAGVSDALIAVLDEASAGRDEDSARALASIADRHRALLDETAAPDPALREAREATETALASLEAMRRGVALLEDASPWVRARFVGAGEILSSRIVAAALAADGIACEWIDARGAIRTEGVEPEKDRPDLAATERLVREVVAPRLGKGRAAVTQGFIAADPRGRPTLLGRGGSDYSASLLGAALGAERIEIWTDVDGVLTASPKIVPEARRVKVLSFAEASELAYFGAKVLHPATILPAVDRAIPVVVLNARRPEGSGTTIVARPPFDPDDRFVVKSIADKRGITLVSVTSSRMLMAHGFLARIFEVFDRERTSVDLVATSEVSVSLTVDDARRLPAIQEALAAFARVEVEHGLAVICLVGEGMRGKAGLAADVFRAVRFTKPRLITQGASAINLSLVVAKDDADRVVRSLHEAFFRGTLPAAMFGEPFRDLEGAEALAASRETREGDGSSPPESLVAIARRHGTPVYVYDLDRIASRAERLRAAIADDRFRILYACKANAHRDVLRVLREKGVGVEAASPGEVARAIECGHAPANVLLSMTNGRPREIAAALGEGVRVALGSRSDVRRVGALAPGASVLLRINPGFGEGHHAHVVTGGAHSKFGIPVQELDAALDDARASGLRVVGLHAHLGSGILDPSPLVASAKRLLASASRLPDLETVDLGGGFGIPYRDDEPEFNLDAWFAEIADVLATADARPREVIVEPGRWLTGPAGWLVAEVTCRKEAGGLVFIGVDTGLNHLLRPALYGAYHRIVNLTAPEAPTEWVEVVGNVCETTDVFASNRPIPRAEEGHLLAFRDAGAYGFAMASAYNLWPLPGEVAISGGREGGSR